MRLLRIVLAVAVVAVATVAVVRHPLQRYLCNRAKWSAEEWIERASAIHSDFARQAGARRSIARLERCATACAGDWQVHFLRGVLQEIAGRDTVALASYRAALSLEERPEIYYAMSVLQFKNGEPEEALANAAKAALFNVAFADRFDYQMRARLADQVEERRRRLTR